MIKSSTNRGLILLVFVFFLLVNLASSGGHFDSWDGVQTFLVGESMVLKHSAMLYPDVPSIEKLHFDIQTSNNYGKPPTTTLKPGYEPRSLLSAAIVVPFYYASIGLLGHILSASPISVVALSVNSMIISLTSAVIFCFALEIYGSKKIAFVSSLIFNVCCFVWPYINTLFPQPLQALCLVTSAFFIYLSAKRSSKGIYFAGFGGLFLGLSLFAHPASGIVMPGFIAYVIFSMWRTRKKNLLCFLIMLGTILAFAGLVNYWRFGSFTEFGYGGVALLSAHQGWAGLVGLLVSPGAGLIFYFPVVLLVPLALKNMYGENRGLFFLFAYVIFVNWLFVGTLSYAEPIDWTGNAWGPRYLIPVLPFIAIISGTLLLHLRKFHFNSQLLMKVSIIVLCIAGFYVNLLGILIWYIYGYDYGEKQKGLEKYAMIGGRVDSLFMTWIPYYSPIALHMEALASNYPSSIKQTLTYYDYGNAPCSYDIYFFCKFGIVPILLLSIFIAFLGFLIMMQIGISFKLIPRTKTSSTKSQ